MDRIIVENISKEFILNRKRGDSFLENLISFTSFHPRRKKLLVLNNVSFKAKEGENIGFIGANGSGKSTLLMIIAGIYQQDCGKVITNGKIAYLSAINNGIKHKLTMAENIYLSGSILGLRQNDIKNKFDEIVEFSGLREFVDTQVSKFSTGMLLRLAFSITTHCLDHLKLNILLLDEVFSSGGDIDFQNKAKRKMEELISGGTTVVIASHNMELIRKHCDSVIWIEKGKIKEIGNPIKITKQYESSFKTCHKILHISKES